MARPGRATRDDLLKWPTDVADGEFPRLIRRLVWETTPDAVQVGFPAGSGVSAGGVDGWVRAVTGNSYVPAGLSVWELSTQKTGITGKADSDYAKRTSTPDGSPAADAEYIEAILRPWTGRHTWAAGKRNDNRWRNVRGYGVDDIEGWLDTAPVTHSWVSEILGMAPHGYRAAEAWWRGWAGATNPVLPSGVVLAGRDEAAAALMARLVAAPAITTIRGGSPEETRAFIAAVLDQQAGKGNARWLSRAAFVDQVTSWRALAEHPSPLVLVPVTAEVTAEAAHGAAHHIVIPVSAPSAVIELPRIDARTAAMLLRDAGMEEGAAGQAGRLARWSLSSMRRSIAVRPELHTPTWGTSPSRTLRGLLLAGRWNQGHDADQAAVTELTDGTYEALRETLAELARVSDPFVAQIDSSWMLVSVQDAWIQLREAIRADDLDRLGPVLSRVLLERDPSLDLASGERWYAATVGKSFAYSADVRRGLAVTLAMLGIHGGAIDAGHGVSGVQRAGGVVRDLLSAANADATGDTWNSMASVLPVLAEAAPDAFLDGVRDAAAGETPVAVTMFTESEAATATAEPSRHGQLLWALERLAWAPDYFGMVSALLARLAEIDPGGRARNRPFSSLVSIFFLQQPGSPVSAERRMAVIKTLRDRNPAIAWQLMLALLPSQFALYDPTAAPEFRDWKPDKPVSVTTAELVDSIGTLAGWLVVDAGDDTLRWQQLIQMLPFQLKTDRLRFHEALAARVAAQTLGEDGRNALWETLRSLITDHRSRSGQRAGLPAGELDSLQEIEQALAPSDPVQRYEWLFTRQLPDLGDDRQFSDPAYDRAVRERRVAALAEVEGNGLDAVRELASRAVDARVVGACLAQATGDTYRTRVVAMIPAPLADEGLAEGWLAERFQQEGWTWLDGLLAEELAPVQVAVALLASRDYPKAWQTADAIGTPVAEAFWRYFPFSGLGPDFRHAAEASSRMAQAGRVAAAVKLAVIYLDRNGGMPPDVLIALLSQFTQTYQSDPEAGLVTEYDFRSLFEYLNRHADPERGAEVGQLEWVFLTVLGSEPPVSQLYDALTSDPDFFVRVMEITWPADDDPGEDDEQDQDMTPEDEPFTDEHRQLAANGYMLLTTIDRLPGTGTGGHVDAAELRRWAAQVWQRAAESGRRKVAGTLIGQILANAGADDEDGIWPCQPVRDLLEELQSDRVERNLVSRRYNQRGFTTRDPEDGGEQERALAERYRDQATALADTWPQTAAVLRALASMYDTDARREDNWAERFRQRQG